MYGRKELYQLNEYAKPEDDPLLPGESYVLRIDPQVLNKWNDRLARDRKSKPKQFEFNFRFLNFGDGSGFLDKYGNPFSGRLRQSGNGALIKQNLVRQGANGMNINNINKLKNSSAYLYSPKFITTEAPAQDCKKKAVNKQVSIYFVI